MLESQSFIFAEYEKYDFQAILALESRRENPWSEQQIKEHLKHSLEFSGCEQSLDRLKTSTANRLVSFVLRKAGICIGYCFLQQIFENADLLLIVIDDKYRKQGLGETLLRKSLATLKCLDTHSCFLDVRVSNSAAQALYKKLGFKEIAVRKNYYPIATNRSKYNVELCNREDKYKASSNIFKNTEDGLLFKLDLSLL